MAGIKKEYIDFRKGIKRSIPPMYNIRCDSDLAVDNTTVRRIPCTYLFCIEHINFPWDNNEEDDN